MTRHAESPATYTLARMSHEVTQSALYTPRVDKSKALRAVYKLPSDVFLVNFVAFTGKIHW